MDVPNPDVLNDISTVMECHMTHVAEQNRSF